MTRPRQYTQVWNHLHSSSPRTLKHCLGRAKASVRLCSLSLCRVYPLLYSVFLFWFLPMNSLQSLCTDHVLALCLILDGVSYVAIFSYSNFRQHHRTVINYTNVAEANTFSHTTSSVLKGRHSSNQFALLSRSPKPLLFLRSCPYICLSLQSLYLSLH